ncbi:MAG TPA: ABC transporter ATP-binding protein [Terriglobales bacterium]|nr:ABC transporter ATP-binding protein [Terriglobales bacterium]
MPEFEPANMNGIIFESVHKVFQRGGFWPFGRRMSETHALKGISLKVLPGEVLGLLGPNGSGKSTTLKLISTVLLPDRGRVVVHGFDTRKHGQAVRRRVGLALASERSFFPRLTVRENLEFFAALEDVPRSDTPSRITGVLSQVDLAEAANKQAMKLSSGMYQRLAIARALIKHPSVLLLDEPTRSLDAAATSDMWRLIKQLSRQGISAVLATHNFEEATAVCDRVALLHNGELIEEQQLGNLMPEELRDLYLGMTESGDKKILELGVSA